MGHGAQPLFVNKKRYVVSLRGLAASAALAALCVGFGSAAYAQGTSEQATSEPSALEQAAAKSNEPSTVDIDPWQPLNRHTFKVYLFVDDNILVPVAKGYRKVTTAKARKGLRNFLDNAASPNTFLNDILQGEFKRGGQTFARFAINSTIGFFGAGDVAGHLGVKGHSEDFGQTLAVWGVPQGPFLYVPLLGPTTVRDGVGFGVDIVAEPLFWIDTTASNYARSARFGATAVALRESAIEPLDNIRRDSLDYYSSLRSYYLQSRKHEIANGRDTFEDLPDITDDSGLDGPAPGDSSPK